MAKKKFAHSKLGKPPGYLVYTGDKSHINTRFEFIEIHKGEMTETSFTNLEELAARRKKDALTWINVEGLSNVNLLSDVGKAFAIHALSLEDTVNVNSRPKFEEYDDYVFIVLKMLYYEEENLVVEHVSFVMLENCIISFQELRQDVFESVRIRLREGKGRIRTAGIDYLLYALIDALVDHYFVIFENFGDKIEDLENEILLEPDDEISLKIQRLKKEVYKIRKAAFPLREVMSRFERSEHKLMQESTKPFIRDVHDHSIQIIETVENYREMTMGLMDLYMSSISNKMNNVMKVLTIIATIFIPLTFIAGVYGMNFEHMPELHYKYAYFILWGVFVVMFIAMLIAFRKRKWL
ncbi:MAG: magnesium/cobalt transporter CorA [Chitinophagales bacterium]